MPTAGWRRAPAHRPRPVPDVGESSDPGCSGTTVTAHGPRYKRSIGYLPGDRHEVEVLTMTIDGRWDRRLRHRSARHAALAGQSADRPRAAMDVDRGDATCRTAMGVHSGTHMDGRCTSSAMRPASTRCRWRPRWARRAIEIADTARSQPSCCPTTCRPASGCSSARPTRRGAGRSRLVEDFVAISETAPKFGQHRDPDGRCRLPLRRRLR